MPFLRFLLSLSLFVLSDGSRGDCFVTGGGRRRGGGFVTGGHRRLGGFVEWHRILPWRSRRRMASKSDVEVDGKRGDSESSPAPSKSLGRRERKRLMVRQEHERRRDAWLARYGSAEALQRTFGDGDNRSLSPSQTRALYHALLPRSLLALSELGVLDPSDLAPLAYQARIAAKEYARSRSSLKSRVITALVDQYRSVKKGEGLLLGPNANPSMTWEDVWDKYEAQIMEQEIQGARLDDEDSTPNVDEEELVMRIYMRILEKSCATNQAFDGLFLKEDNGEDEGDLAAISAQLEEDIQSILLSPKEADKVMKRKEKMEKKRAEALEKEDKVARKETKRKDKLERKRMDAAEKEEKKRDKLKSKLARQRRKMARTDELAGEEQD